MYTARNTIVIERYKIRNTNIIHQDRKQSCHIIRSAGGQMF